MPCLTLVVRRTQETASTRRALLTAGTQPNRRTAGPDHLGWALVSEPLILGIESTCDETGVT